MTINPTQPASQPAHAEILPRSSGGHRDPASGKGTVSQDTRARIGNLMRQTVCAAGTANQDDQEQQREEDSDIFPNDMRSDQSLRQGGTGSTGSEPRNGTEKPHHLDIQHDDINCKVVINRRPPSQERIRWAEQMYISCVATHPQVKRICAAATTIAVSLGDTAATKATPVPLDDPCRVLHKQWYDRIQSNEEVHDFIPSEVAHEALSAYCNRTYTERANHRHGEPQAHKK